jgi:hypothetical protein
MEEVEAMTTGYGFVASHVYVHSDDALCVVGFADDAFDPSKSVVVQMSLAPTESERGMGLDGVHLQVEDQSRSACAAIQSIRVGPGSVRILLRPEARSILKTGGDIEITGAHPACDEAISALKRMCGIDGIPVVP